MNIFKELGLPQEKDRLDEEILYNLARAYMIASKFMNSFLSGFKLSPAKFNILLITKHIGKGKGLSQSAISKRLLVTGANITKLIDKLQKDGLVRRLDKAGDRRVNLIKITEEGKALLNKVWPLYLKKISKLTRSFPDSEKEALIKSLEKIRRYSE